MPCQVQSWNIDGKVRTSDDPCGAFCSFPDFRAWRSAARFEVARALQRQDMQPATRDQLLRWSAEIDAMQEGWLRSQGDTRWLASVAHLAHCVGIQGAPTVPVSERPTTSEDVLRWAVYLGAGWIAWQVLKEARAWR